MNGGRRSRRCSESEGVADNRGYHGSFFHARSLEMGAEFVVAGECMQSHNIPRKLAVFHSYLYRPKG